MVLSYGVVKVCFMELSPVKRANYVIIFFKLTPQCQFIQ